MAVEFNPNALYSMDELRQILPCSPETFLERLAIPRRLNGVILGADICAAMQRCARSTLEGIPETVTRETNPHPRKQTTKAAVQALEPLNSKTILEQRGARRS